VAIVNLLEETLEKLARCGLTTSDVRWVGWSNGWQVVDWPIFVDFANREYDNQSPTLQVHHQLVIVGQDWWLERDLVIDSDTGNQQEEWVYRSMPEPLKREYQTDYFFAFSEEEQAALDDPEYQEELRKLRRLIYGE
jgi:hypothetical protein